MTFRRHFFGKIFVITLLTFVVPSTVLAGYTFVDLGGFYQGMDDRANAINDQGEIVGTLIADGQYPYQHAFLYRDGVLTDINPAGSLRSLALDINNAGTIVGSYLINGEDHAFSYYNGQLIDLNPLISSEETSIYSAAYEINENGLIAGQFMTNYINSNVFLYDLSSGDFKDIGRLGEAAWPTGLNDFGQVVGQYRADDGSNRSFVYQNDQMTDLDLPEIQESTNYVWDINNNGQIVGVYQDANGEVHGYVYNLAGPTFEPFNGLPEAINNQGQIVGSMLDELGRYRSGVYDNGEWTLLDSAYIGYPYGGIDINEFGEVVGHSAWHAALWTLKSMIPTDGEQCKEEGWKKYTNPEFKNQGQCVSFVVSSRKE